MELKFCAHVSHHVNYTYIKFHKFSKLLNTIFSRLVHQWENEFSLRGTAAAAYLLAEDLLDEGGVLGDAVDDLRGGGLPRVEEANLLPQDGLQVQVPDPQHLPLARPAPAIPFCSHWFTKQRSASS